MVNICFKFGYTETTGINTVFGQRTFCIDFQLASPSLDLSYYLFVSVQPLVDRLINWSS